MPTVKLAIVILNWNGADMLHRYLPSVIRCSQMDGVQVYVADNASTDRSLAVMQTEFPDIPVIRLDRNYGFAEGYNRALQTIEAQYYLLLNSDVEIRQPRWVQPMLRRMDAEPDIAACQPKLLQLYDDGTPAPPTPRFEYAGAAGGFIDRYGYPFCRGRIFATTEPDLGQYDTDCDLHWATGAALMVRAADYHAVGGLDARFFAHQEEIDLCWRLRLRGRRIVCVSQSTAFHLGGATLNKDNPQKTFLNFRNNLLLLYKNLPDAALRPTLRRRRWLDLLAALQYLLRTDIANFKAVRRARREFKKMTAEYAGHRAQIQQQATAAAPRSPYSILWQYYVRRRTRFTQL